jgi:hypothetical protein
MKSLDLSNYFFFVCFQISELLELVADAGHVLQRAARRVHVWPRPGDDPVSELVGKELQAEQG